MRTIENKRLARRIALAAVLSSLVAGAENAKADMLSDILGLRTDVTALTTNVSGLGTTVGGLDADVDALDATVDGLGATLGGLNASVANNSVDILGQGVRIDAVDARLLDQANRLTTLQTGLTGTTDRLGSGLADLRVDLGNLRSSVGGDLAGVRTSLGDLKVGLDRTRVDLDVLSRTDIDSKWRTSIDERISRHDTTISDLRGDTGIHGTRLDAHNEILVRHKDVLNGHETTLTAHEETLADHQTTLGAQQTMLGTHESTLANHQTTLDTHEAALAGHETALGTHTAELGVLRERDAGMIREMDAHRDAIMQNADDVAALGQRMDGGFGRLDEAVADVDRRVDKTQEGVAVALALKSPYVPENKTFALSGGWGNFEGSNAFGVSGGLRANDMVQVDAGIAFGVEDQAVGGRAGATVSW